jgi:hypothetical protein
VLPQQEMLITMEIITEEGQFLVEEEEEDEEMQEEGELLVEEESLVKRL